MNNISEYLKWRGDVSFRQVPMNEVDAYVLAKIGVPDLTGCVPAEGEGVPLREAYGRYFARTDIDPDYFGRLNQPVLAKTLRMLPDTERFGGLMLSNYVRKHNVQVDEQISALTITLPDGTAAVTFRGTDDTIVGWKENFLMAARDAVTAQEDAAYYLTRAAELFPGPLTVLGHSKGGNLAVYAAAAVREETQERIESVWNFDGPGFREAFWRQPGTERIRERVFTYVPQNSIVGLLLNQTDRLTVCRSKRSGPLSHEAMNWEVMGPRFIREAGLSAGSRKFDRLIDEQAESMSEEEIVRFVEEFFGILTSTGAETLTELTRQSPENLHRLLKELNASESVKELGKEILDLLFRDRKKLPDVLRQLRGRRREKP